MSKEAECFFRQKTIENAKSPRKKKFLALVNREAEGKILQEYANKSLHCVSQQRKLLLDFMNYHYEKHHYSYPISEIDIENFINANNCG